MFYSIGAIISGLLVVKLSHYLNKYKLISLAFLITIISGLVLVYTNIIFLSCLIMMVFGMSGSGVRILMNTEIMTAAPSGILGGLMSFFNFIGLVFQIVFSTFIGFTMDYVGSNYAFIFYSLVMLMGFCFINICYSNLKSKKD